MDLHCSCWYCTNNKPHPTTTVHSQFDQLSPILLVAESLDPEDMIPVKACIICGHLVYGED